MDLSIFKEYDVRGIYPKEINEKIAYKIGGALVCLLRGQNGQKKLRIAVGKDVRKSSNPLAENFIKGVTDAGADVINIGTTTSPALYYSVAELKTDGGAMITASHNPQTYNGIKLLRKNGEPIGGEEIKNFFLKTSPTKGKGVVKNVDISKRYLNEISKNFDITKKTKISFGKNKTSANIFIPELIKILKLSEDKRAGFSVSFDYDADRLMVNDKENKEIRGDIIGGIIGDTVTNKGDIIIYDLRCSHAIPEYFRNKGVRAIPNRAGNTNIKKAMRKHKAVFGMEITGHYFFKKFDYHETPFFALRKLIEKLNEIPKLKISDLSLPFKKYFHSGVLNIKTKKDFGEIVENLKKNYPAGAQGNIDGLSIEFSNWWFNIRPSHTEPLVRLVIEAKSPEILKEKKKELLEKIEAI